MTNCFMIREIPATGPRIVVRRTAAIGDCLSASCVADRLSEMGYRVEMQTHPDIWCVLRRQPNVASVAPVTGPPNVDLDRAYERDPMRRQKHFTTMWFESANRQLNPRGIQLGSPVNCRPRIKVYEHEKEISRQKFAAYPRPWVFICPRSKSYNVRQVPNGIWGEAAKRIQATVFWLGDDPAPQGIVDLQCRHLDNLVVWLSVADLLLTVDTGPMHIAAALGIPIVAMNQSSSPSLHLNDQTDFVEISPGLDCLNCQDNLCRINRELPPCQNIPPELIAAWANARLNTNDVSAVVPIYQPEVGVLNRCLKCLLPQVQEIVVSAEGNSIVPSGALRDGKIRYVRTPKRGIGFSGNANFGSRSANGKWLLQINDDVFAEPDAVEKMRAAMTDRVGIVSGMLFYPDGTIYHAGKVRSPGERGWGHAEHRQRHTRFTDVTELENVNLAMALIRREAFFQAGCFDEELSVYASDDALALSIRREGYRVLFTPFSKGTHIEHASTSKLGNIRDLVNSANKVFDRKWGPYLTWNLNRCPMGDFGYLNK